MNLYWSQIFKIKTFILIIMYKCCKQFDKKYQDIYDFTNVDHQEGFGEH